MSALDDACAVLERDYIDVGGIGYHAALAALVAECEADRARREPPERVELGELLVRVVEVTEGWIKIEHYPGGSSGVNRVWAVVAHGEPGARGDTSWEPTLPDALRALLAKVEPPAVIP